MTKADTLIHTQQDGDSRISVHDDGAKRWLAFSGDKGEDGDMQSIIDRDHPQTLVSPVCQALLAGLLFTPEPRQFLLLGLGGGAIARYLSQRQPHCYGDVVERSAAVADIAQQFFEFPQENWQIHLTDAQDFVSQAHNDLERQTEPHHYDYIVLDIAEQQASPDWLTEPTFLNHCREQLSRQGVMSINLVPRDAADFLKLLSRIRLAFDGQTLCLSVPEYHNVLVLAFAERPEITDFHQLHQRATRLTQQGGLPFNDFLNRMTQENPIGSGIF